MKQEKITSISEKKVIPLCIEFLIERLHSIDGAERKKARETLGKIGKPVVTYIKESLAHPDRHIRWEACKILERVREPETAHVLTTMLMDDDMDVRWVAADALIELEHHAVEPLLEMIEEHFDSAVFREAAHHVLHSMKEKNQLDEKITEVLVALKMNELPSKAAFAAIQALDHLRSHSLTEH